MADIFDNLKETQKLMKRANSDLEKTLLNLESENFDTASDEAEEALYRLEKALIRHRTTVFEININFPQKRKNIESELASLLGIDVDVMKIPFTVYKITLPFLLSNRRSNWSQFKKSIAITFQSYLESFVRENEVEILDKAAVIFVSSYNRFTTKYCSDNDNKEEADILNVITDYLIQNDDGESCDVLNISSKTMDKTCTTVYVMSQENFRNNAEILRLIL